METVGSWKDIEDNIFLLESYRNSVKYYNDYYELIKKGTCFVVFERSGRLFLGPSRFIGYKNNDIETHKKNTEKHGSETNSAISKIINCEPEYNDNLENEYKKFCFYNGIEPEEKGSFGHKRKYWFYGKKEVRSSIEANIQDIIGFNIDTEKEQQILCRIGQGHFRESLINLWNGCSVTSSKLIDMLRASHIKPWRVSNNQERLDKYNGLLLIPNLDTAFDKGIISFDNYGKILISSKYNYSEIEKLGITKDMKIIIKNENKKYIEYHQNNIFIK